MQGMLARCAALALTVAVAVAAFVAVAAWAHNPQQAFHDASGPRWSALMSLFLRALDKEVDELRAQGVRLRFVGQLDGFGDDLRRRMDQAMARTAANTRLQLGIAVNYGGRWDVVQAARQAALAVGRGELAADALDEATLGRWMCLADAPPLDLFIRTGGERRISNFLLWQVAYAELYFTETLWPDFDQACLARAIDDYARRERRYGRTSEQIAQAPAR